MQLYKCPVSWHMSNTKISFWISDNITLQYWNSYNYDHVGDCSKSQWTWKRSKELQNFGLSTKIFILISFPNKQTYTNWLLGTNKPSTKISNLPSAVCIIGCFRTLCFGAVVPVKWTDTCILAFEIELKILLQMTHL